MQSDFELQLRRRETSMSDRVVLVDKFDGKDWFSRLKRGCFLDAKSPSSRHRHERREALQLTKRKLLDQLFWRQSETAVQLAMVPTVSGLS